MTAGERRHLPSAAREARLREIQIKAAAPTQRVAKVPLQPQPKAPPPPADARAYAPYIDEVSQAMERTNEATAILDGMRAALKKRTVNADGHSGIEGLGRNFRICDRDGSGQLDAAEFSKCIALCKLSMSADHVAKLHAFFDRDGNGTSEHARPTSAPRHLHADTCVRRASLANMTPLPVHERGSPHALVAASRSC